MSFGPVNLGLSPDRVRARVDGALAALGITGLADRPTHMLSFGQRPRSSATPRCCARPAWAPA